MKLAKLFLGEFEFGTHMVSQDTWNGWSIPCIKEEDMESFAKKVYDAFFECSYDYDLLEKVDGEWVWNLYELQEDGKSVRNVETMRILPFEHGGVTYYDVQIGHCWEHEEVA